mgnify:CR=1 FL=1
MKALFLSILALLPAAASAQRDTLGVLERSSVFSAEDERAVAGFHTESPAMMLYRSEQSLSQISLRIDLRREQEALLQPLLAHLPRTACVPVGTNPSPLPQELRRFSETMPLAQSRISLGFRTDVTLRSAQYPAMLLLNAMLGGGEQNRLYTVVRGRMALCYEAGSWYDGHKGILAASAGCGRADLPAVEQEILHQLAELAAGRFSQSELETARTGLLSDLRLLCDSPGRLDEFYTGRAAEGISQSPAELAAALCAVTAEDVCAAARRVRPDAVYTLEEA